MRRHTPLTLTTLITLASLGGCAAEPGDELDAVELRELELSADFELEPTAYVDQPSCADYYASRCEGRSDAACSLIEGRFACRAYDDERLEIVDRYASLIEATRWTGFGADDPSPSVADEPSALCDQIGCDPDRCLALAAAASTLASHRDELVSHFGGGGLGSVTRAGDALVLGPPSPSETPDLHTILSEELGWPTPALSGDSLALASAAVELDELGPETTALVRPNGSVRVSDQSCSISSEPVPFSTNPNVFHYTMHFPLLSAPSWYGIGAPGGWTRYAMHWKEKVGGPNIAWVDLASSYGGDNFAPLLGAEAVLDGYEASNFYDHYQNPWDPPGEWLEVQIPSSEVGMVFAALTMWYWGTPVFLSGRWWSADSSLPANSWYRYIALERLSFRSSTYTNLFAACGLSPWDPAHVSLGALQNNNTCDFNDLEVYYGAATAWVGPGSDPGAPTMITHRHINGAWLEAVYNWGHMIDETTQAGRRGELIFDPPAGVDDAEIDAVLGLAEAMSAAFAVEDEVELME